MIHLDHNPRDTSKVEYVRVVSRRGCFDWLHPNVESVSTHIAICTSDEKQICTRLSCNISTEEEIDDPDIDALVFAINDYLKRVWSSDDPQRVVVRDYLLSHRDALECGGWIKKRERLKKQKKTIELDIAKLESCIDSYEEESKRFVKGAWVIPEGSV